MAKKTPTRVNTSYRFQDCPHCGSKKLVEFDGEFFCEECEWDSDDLFARVKSILDHGYVPQNSFDDESEEDTFELKLREDRDEE